MGHLEKHTVSHHPLHMLALSAALLGACNDNQPEDTDAPYIEATPALSLSGPANGAVVDTDSIELTATVLEASADGLRWSVNDALAGETAGPLDPGTATTATLALDAGSNRISVEAFTHAGTSTVAEWVVFYQAPDAPEDDTTAPTIDSVWPTDGHSVVSTAPMVWGLVFDNDLVSSVQIEQGEQLIEAELLDDGRFAARLSGLVPGDNTFTVLATDASGNSSELERSVWLGSRVAAGGSHSAWLDTDGTLYMWGRNNTGQIGLGYTSSLGDEEVDHPSTPTAVPLEVSLISVVAYQNTSVALASDGSLYGWGDNRYGRLGLGASATDEVLDEDDRSTPVAIPGVSGAVSIAGGYYHTLVLLDDGTVMAMGRNSDGQLGDGSTDNRDRAVAVSGLSDIVQIAAGSSTSFALDSSGNLYSWGANDYAQLGTGSVDDEAHSSATLVEGLPPLAHLAAGKDHVVAVDETGAVWAWGLNASNQVGGIQHGLSASPIETPSKLEHLGTAVAVYANGNQSYYETDDGLLYGWGQNGSVGALDVTVDGDLPEPVGPVFGLTDIADVGTGALHSVVLRRDGQAFAWGWSFEGSLGAGEGAIDRWGYRIPIQVSPL